MYVCVCVHALKLHGDAGNVIVLQLPKDGSDIVSYPARMLDRRTGSVFRKWSKGSEKTIAGAEHIKNKNCGGPPPVTG